MEQINKAIFKPLYFLGNKIVKNKVKVKKLDACDETYPYNPPGPALLK
jgi:hypothetical protein